MDRCYVLVSVIIGVLAVPCLVAAQPRTTLDVLGFDKTAENMLVRIDDNQVGLGLRLYEVKTGKPAKKSQLIAYERGDEVATIKAARKRFKIVDPGLEDTRTEDKAIAFFGVAKEETLVIAATDYKRLGKLTDVPLALDEETKTRATAMLRAIVWTADRKLMVLVVTQKMKGDAAYERDELIALEWKPTSVKWVKGEKKPEEDKKDGEKKDEEKKDEDKGWWPF